MRWNLDDELCRPRQLDYQWGDRDTAGVGPIAVIAGFSVNPYPGDSDILSAHVTRRFASIAHRCHLNSCVPGSDVQSSIVNTEL